MDIWKHGKYLDMWSIVHFLSGVLLSGLLLWLEMDFLKSLVITTVVLVLWEIVEWLTKIIEPSANVAVDLIVGLLGFALAWYLYLDRGFDLSNYVVLVVLTLAIALWGFFDFKKRGYR